MKKKPKPPLLFLYDFFEILLPLLPPREAEAALADDDDACPTESDDPASTL